MLKKYLSNVNNKQSATCNRLNLKFINDYSELESTFHDSYHNKFYLHIRMCHLYSIFFFNIYSLFFFFLFPDLHERYNIISLGIISPIFLTGFFLSFFNFYKKTYQYFAVFYILLTGTGIIFAMPTPPDNDIWLYIIGLITCYIFGYTYIHAYFLSASIAGWMLLVIYVLTVSFLNRLSPSLIISSTLPLVMTNVLGMLVSYNLERAARQDFILQWRLTREEEKLADVNIKLSKANEHLLHLSFYDELTQIANRRQFDERLHSDYYRCARYKLPLTLVMLDIDHFKLFNDRYGHQEGDKYLKEVAQIIDKNSKRSIDLATRYGGEEFAIILYNSDTDHAMHICQRIQRDLKKLFIPDKTSSSKNNVTLSMGIACDYPSSDGSSDTILKAADEALYKAKNTGRDRIVIAGNKREK